MVLNQKPTGRAMSMPAGLIAGSAASLGVTLVMAAILSKLLDAEVLAWENAGYGIMVLLLLASTLGAITAYGKIKRQRLVVCLLSGVIYFCILMSITALFFGGQYEAVGVTAMLVIGASMAVGLLGLHEGKGRSRKKVLRQHR